MIRTFVVTTFLIAATALPTGAEAKKPSKQSVAAQGSTAYAQRADALQFADDVAARRDLDPSWVRQAIAQARLLPVAQRLVLPPPKGQAKNWQAYRARFVEPVRIRAGVRFWNDNADALARAEQEFGVPQEIIIGILGVETIYGQQMGNFRVLDALATLAFDFPSAHPRAAERQAFFQRELEQFLSLMHRTGTDPGQYRGSFAGAMGLPQFMPSSWGRYAIDFDGDGHVDLFNSPADAIGSVANYFVGHGWKSGMPTHYAVQPLGTPAQTEELLLPDILPSFSPERMQALGAQIDAAGQHHGGALALVELQNGGEAPSYVAGTDNFYAITRYNWSAYYAMAVIELGQAVKAARAAAR